MRGGPVLERVSVFCFCLVKQWQQAQPETAACQCYTMSVPLYGYRDCGVRWGVYETGWVVGVCF
jgi:hypothetical protein